MTAPPGHPDAVNAGCLCPQMDNGHGQGSGYVGLDGSPMFWFSQDCPIHGGEKAEPIDPATVLYKSPGGPGSKVEGEGVGE